MQGLSTHRGAQIFVPPYAMQAESAPHSQSAVQLSHQAAALTHSPSGPQASPSAQPVSPQPPQLLEVGAQ